MSELTAIDPDGCGCTDCLTGRSVPLERATADQIRRMFLGWLDNRTSARFTRSVNINAEGTAYSWLMEEL